MDRAFLSATRSLLGALVRSGTYRAVVAPIAVPMLLVQAAATGWCHPHRGAPEPVPDAEHE
jgi:hypothetical protein